MTTNHIDRLDPALIRPGRVDYVQLVDNATDHQVRDSTVLVKLIYLICVMCVDQENIQKVLCGGGRGDGRAVCL